MLKPAILILSSGALLSSVHLTGMAQEGAAGQSGDTIRGVMPPPLHIIAPTELRADPTLARGCWVRLFPQPEYKGTDDLTIAGPITIPSLHNPTGGANGVYWKPKAESFIVGPRATVTVYENPSFRGRSARLEPGTQEGQLRDKLKFTQSIDSLKIECGR